MVERAHAPTGWLVGAYASAPSRDGWEPTSEWAFYDRIWRLPGVSGVELPWRRGAWHDRDEPTLLASIPPESQIVITTAPDVGAHLRRDARFGLASTDSAGRAAAVDAVRQMHRAIPRLRDTVPGSNVQAVELHAAPTAVPGAASSEALRRSLEEVLAWEWGGTRIVIEHCDAWAPDVSPQKGYLDLGDEIAVIQRLRESGAPVGMAINWGRSAIEGRSADTGRAHAEAATNAGVLDGIVFSGAASVATPLGGAWADRHIPLADDAAYVSSLLTVDRMIDTLAASGALRFRGIKIAAAEGVSVEARVDAIERTLVAAQAASAAVGFESS